MIYLYYIETNYNTEEKQAKILQYNENNFCSATVDSLVLVFACGILYDKLTGHMVQI